MTSLEQLIELNDAINLRLDVLGLGSGPGHTMARFIKLIEELGEAASEEIAFDGLNFRKPRDLKASARYATELLDCALTSLLAYFDHTGNDPLAALTLHIDDRHRRAMEA